MNNDNNIVLVYTHEIISTMLKLDICRREPLKLNLIIDIWKGKFSLAITHK